jgi:diguanylate cyclase (GGDEF)-like protein
MTVEVERRTEDTGQSGQVSGTVVHSLLALVQARDGESGVAQALALAGESRPFSALDDSSSWSSLDQSVALFNAAALVTGDAAVARHLGEDLLFLPDPSGFVGRLQALGSPGVAIKHIGPVLEHFELVSKAETLETAADHALVKVSARTTPHRHAHLCELTRGLLESLPTLWELDPALITEVECSARGGRYCLYAMSWDGPGTDAGPDDDGFTALDPADIDPGRHDETGYDDTGYDETGYDETGWPDDADGNPPEAWDGPAPDERDSPDPTAAPLGAERARVPGAGGPAPDSAFGELGDLGRFEAGGVGGNGSAGGHGHRGNGESSGAVPSPTDAAERSVAELRAELNRMGVLIEGTFATALELLGDDVESLLSQIAARADAVVTAHRYLLMVRVRPGSPIQLHHRGLEPDEAQRLAAELWSEHPRDGDAGRLVVDIASPRRRYGRLAEFLAPGAVHPPSENKVLSLYAEYAATALDIFGVLLDAKQSDATARTLLSFSEALSRVNNVGDLVQVLADTVPDVTECADSTVHLWDHELRQLVPRARTTGSEPGGVFSGAIVPLSGSEALPPMQGFVGSSDSDAGPEGAVGASALGVRRDAPHIGRMLDKREVMVLDQSTDDPLIQEMLDQAGIVASVVAPLFANAEFLGVVAANFGPDTPKSAIHDPDLHERLSGLADQAATTLQNLELLEKVSHMAWHDSLTGLPNRRLFEDRVDQELVRSRRVGEPVCMFFVDLDHFKTVNDTMGHSAGDDLIRQVSQRLVDTVRSQDTVARVGGDEFAILLPGLADQLAIDQLAVRSLEAMSTPYVVFGEEVVTSASIGIAVAPDHGDTYDELLSHADEAMYRAKARGRNAYQMYSIAADAADAGQPRAIDDRSLYADLVSALERDEFFLLYQPYIDLRTTQITGVEALIRWNHPTLGMLEPSTFIPLAERSDIIVALDTWVLQQACRQARAWIDQGLPSMSISVNLASRDLSNPELFHNIDHALEETGIDPTMLELEITERVVLDRTGPARENIERLRRLGVRFTIDDFGTGNSSLSRIGAFPVSTLKIDQSFVQVLGPDSEDNSLVSAIISMADRLGLNCVAEGVETSNQRRMLMQRGCTTAQGYFFSPPLPPAEIEVLMANISVGDDREAPEGDGAADEKA